MTVWIAQVSIATPMVLDEQRLDEQRLDALADAADVREATVSRRAAGPGYRITLSVDADDPLNAAQDGIRFARHGLGADVRGEVVDLRVTTPEQFEAEALGPDFPPLASAADAAEILGVSRQRVHQLAASNARFPAPVARVATGPLWTVPAIEHFHRIWERKPGRPNRSQESEVPDLRLVAAGAAEGMDREGFDELL